MAMLEQGVAEPAKPVWGAMRRQAFEPPITIVRPWDAERGWDAAGSVAALTDPLGDRIEAAPAVDLRLALEGEHLRLRAEVHEAEPVRHRDAEPGSGAFWSQDLIEWRLLLGEAGQQWQVGLASHGAAWDTAGLYQSDASLSVRPFDVAHGWGLEARLRLADLGLPTPAPGRSIDLYGFIAHLGWKAGFARAATQSPSEQGFGQIDRFGIFRLVGDACTAGPVAARRLSLRIPELSEGSNGGYLTLRNTTDEAVSGRLHVTHEHGDGGTVTTTTPVRMAGGGGAATAVGISLTPSVFTRVRFAFEGPGGRHDLGAVSLRPMPGHKPLGFDVSTLGHPYLFATPGNLAKHDARRKRMPDTTPRPKPGEKARRGEAERPLVPRLVAKLGGVYDHWLGSRELQGMDALSALAAEAGPDVTVTADESDPEGFKSHLSFGMSAGRLALAYDGLHEQLDEPTRRVVRRIASQMLEAYLDEIDRRAWPCTTNANANTITHSGGGLLALALLNEHPDAERALAAARRWVWRFMNYCQAPDGANTEGMQYWEYGLTHLLRFAVMLEQVTGTDDGLLSHPSIEKLSNMIRVGLCPDGGGHGMNDTIPCPVGAELAYFAAGRFGDPLALWYGDHAVRWFNDRYASGKHAPNRMLGSWSILFRPDAPEATEAPPLPTAFALRSIEYGILRSAPRYDAQWAAGMKGSRAPFTHHAQPDAGALFVHLRAERLLIDPGYNLGKPEHHCLPLIDGVGPTRGGDYGGALTDCVDGAAWRLLVCDATRAYGEAAARVRRLLLMFDGGPVLWLDDIAPTGNGQVRAQFQCGGAPAMNEAHPALVINGKAATMRVDLLNADKPRFERHPRVELTKWGYCFADCEMHPVTADYAAEAGRPLVTVCQDATEAAADTPRCEPHGNMLRVVLPDGRFARFVRHETGWQLAEAGRG